MRLTARAPLFAILLLAPLVLLLAGCSCQTGVAAVAPPAQVAGAVCQPCVAAPPAAAAPCGVQTVQVVSGPQVAANGVQYVQVQYRVGAAEWGRAGLAIPGNLVVCAGNFLRCAMEALFPIPQPTAQLVAAPAPQAVQLVPSAPPASAPCAPAAPTPPTGKWVFVPGEPAARVDTPPDLCPGGVCTVPDGSVAAR